MSGTDKRATSGTAPKSGKPASAAAAVAAGSGNSRSTRDAGEGAAAVSMPKQAAARGGAAGINFGTVDDQHAVISSSPAAQPTTGEHLRGGNPTVFGSVSAESGAAHEKKIGFALKKQLDFQKLFQGKKPQDKEQPQQAPQAPPAQQTGPASSASQGQGPSGKSPAQGPAHPMPSPMAGGNPPPFVSPWQPPMYPHVGYPMSPGPGGYPPYMAQPQQPWNQPAPGSPSVMTPPNASPHLAHGPGSMQPRPANGAQFFHGAPAQGPPSNSSGFSMSAGARMFEPQKSKALRIVNPETHAEIDLNSLKKAAAPAAASSTTESKPAPAKASSVTNESRVKTQNDFQQKVLKLKMEKEAEAKRAEEAKREAERKAEEAKREEERKAEEARREEERKAEEARREEERKAEEARREEERKAEEARREEERKAEEAKREEERKAEEARREEERKAEEAKREEERKAAEAKRDEERKAEEAKREDEKKAAESAGEAKEHTSESADDAEPQAEKRGESSRAVEHARLIDDLAAVTYPPDVHPPNAELNRDAAPGKYRYDRDFLLQFMSVYTEKPFDLPDLASIGMESVVNRMGGSGGRRGAAPRGGLGGGRGGAGRTSEERFASSVRAGAFGGPMGSFQPGARGSSRTGGGPVPSRETMGTGIPMGGGRSKSNRGRQREGGRRENPPEKGGPTIPLDQVVPLEFSENRWKPQSREKEKIDHSQVVERKVKSLLNKLTVEKFESISDKIVDFANESESETDGHTLRQVIALVFEKAIDESAWSEIYAQLCAKIQTNLSPNIRDEVLDEKEQKEYRGGMLFRKYLLTWCQGDFEKGWGAGKEERNEKELELMSDEYYEAQKAKRRGLGLVQFVGELFKLQMLQPRIMHTCIVRLLRTTTEPEEDEIESVCRLLTTVGYLLDSASGNHKSRMDVYFKRIDDILKSPALSSRMRFMLMDVVDLRNNQWVPRHDQSAPKTIAEIHAEAAKQQQQKEAEKFTLSRGGSRRGPTRGGGASHAPQDHSHDGWSTVGNAAPMRGGRDMPGFGKGSERASNGKAGSGPQSAFQRRNQKDEERSASPTPNMFNLLGESGSGAGEEGGRKKLQLQPRTKPLEEDKDDAPAEPSDDDIKRKIGNDVKEYLEIRDLNEGIQSIEALPAKHRPAFVDALVTSVLDKKQDSVDMAGQLLHALAERSLVDEAALMEGFAPQVTILDDTSMDAPSAYAFMAQLLVQSTLPRAQIEALADKMEGEGIKPPKDRLLAKVDDVESA